MKLRPFFIPDFAFGGQKDFDGIWLKTRWFGYPVRVHVRQLFADADAHKISPAAGNLIDDEGTAALAEALAANRTVTALNLRSVLCLQMASHHLWLVVCFFTSILFPAYLYFVCMLVCSSGSGSLLCSTQ